MIDRAVVDNPRIPWTRYAPLWPYLRWVGFGALIGFCIFSPIPAGSDAHNYYALDLADPYRNRWFDHESFVYSPAFGQLLYPLTLLPVEVFYKVIQGVNIVCLGWLLGPVWGAASLVLPPVQAELGTNNIHLPLAVMCVVGLRYPAAWAFGLLTKVTPGVVAFWYIARWEWRPILITAGVTAGIFAVSYVTLPEAWSEWFGLLLESPTRTEATFSVSEWPVVFRLPLAAGLMVMASWRDRPAAIPAIVCFALPAIWLGSLTLLLAVPRLARR
jgi:hypothetical protein